MGAVEVIGLAASVSLLAGWRLYLCIFAVGLAMQSGWVELPQQLKMLDTLANPWVIGVAGFGALAEFLADKVMWVDTVWDSIHTAIRPVGGALLALAIVDPSDPAWQIIALLLGGGGALLTHGAKAGARVAVNASPEPVSNIAVSTGEDLLTGGLLVAALASPVAAIAIAALTLCATLAALFFLRRALRRIFRRAPQPPGTPGR